MRSLAEILLFILFFTELKHPKSPTQQCSGQGYPDNQIWAFFLATCADVFSLILTSSTKLETVSITVRALISYGLLWSWIIYGPVPINNLSAMDGRDRPLKNYLRSTVVSRQIFIRSQSLIAR